MASSISLPGISHGILSRKPRNYLKKHQGFANVGFGRLASILLSSQTGKSLQSSYVTPNMRGFGVCFSNVGPDVPLPSGPSDSNPLKGWLIGILLSVVLPFFRNKFGTFMQIRNAVDKVEEIVHGVEKVAEVVDKVAEEIGENLPAGKLKDAVELVEHAAEKAEKDAEALGDFIDKVEEVEHKLEDGVQSFVELVHYQDEDKPSKVEEIGVESLVEEPTKKENL